MAVSSDWTNYICALAAVDLGKRLNECLKSLGLSPLKSVYVVPSEITRNIGWSDSNYQGQDQLALNRVLGEHGMMFIARDLASELAVRKFIRAEQKRPFCIGLSTGSTVFNLVNSFVSPPLRGSTRVVPLVMGPSPETMHSAGFIATLLAERLNSAASDGAGISHVIDRISELKPYSAVGQAGYLTLQLKEEFAALCRSENTTKFADTFDWIITGVGGKGHGQNLEHEKTYGLDIPDAIGDICSRFFDRSGQEVARAKESSDSIAIATFKGLEEMCKIQGKGKRVFLVGGGYGKYAAIRALIARPQQLFNVLVTDELTVRLLLIELRQYVVKRNSSQGGKQPT